MTRPYSLTLARAMTVVVASWLFASMLFVSIVAGLVELGGSTLVAGPQRYAIPVSVRIVKTEGHGGIPKLTESETFQGLWRISQSALGYTRVSHRGVEVPATLLRAPTGSRLDKTSIAVVIAMTDFLRLLGLYAPASVDLSPGPSPLVEIPLWSYPASVRYAASNQESGYLSFAITTGGPTE